VSIFLILLLGLSVASYFAETIAAVNWLVPTRLEGYFGIFATLGAYRREHLSRGTVAAVTVALSFPGLATRHAALGLVGIALGLEELLLFSAEGEGDTTIGTLELLVLKAQ
jgi:hypothetical protein